MIVNTINDKVYVGQTKNLRTRWSHHRAALRKGKHHCPYLQNSWGMHDEKSFKFVEFMTGLTLEEANQIEQLYIQWFLELQLCYNSYWATENYQRHKMSDEQRAKISRTNKEKGIKPPSRKGTTYTPTEEHKAKLYQNVLKRIAKLEAERITPPCKVCGNPCKEYRYKGKFKKFLRTCGYKACQDQLRVMPDDAARKRAGLTRKKNRNKG